MLVHHRGGLPSEVDKQHAVGGEVLGRLRLAGLVRVPEVLLGVVDIVQKTAGPRAWECRIVYGGLV